MRLIHENQKGLTLVELLIALTIVAVVAVAANAVIVQILQSNHTSSHMVAVRQVQQAGYRVSQDCIQAQSINTSNVTGGFPLTLKWTAWEGGEDHEVVYNLTYEGELQRRETVANTTMEPTTVAQYIEPPNSTECSWNDTENVLTLNITARVGLQTESRTYEIKPRTSI